MPRPGRKPQDPRRIDLKLVFPTAEEGEEVRRRGGGPWVMSLVRNALGQPPTEPAFKTRLVRENGSLELRIALPDQIGDP